uniref:Uncharacterized protein n=1 Tax=Arundo donax TaxID=35708 RepID=A0A0A9B300_ARUDO
MLRGLKHHTRYSVRPYLFENLKLTAYYVNLLTILIASLSSTLTELVLVTLPYVFRVSFIFNRYQEKLNPKIYSRRIVCSF